MCKKVLINYQDRWGSGPSYSIEWAKGLIQNGCEVYAVLSQDVLNINEWKYYLGEKNIYFVQTHEKNNKYDLIKKTIRLYLFERKKIQDFFKDVDFDFSFHTFYCHWSNIIDRFLNIKCIVSVCHDPVAHSGYKFYMQTLFKQNYKKSDIIITLTKSFIEKICEEFSFSRNNVYYIPHGRMNMYNNISETMKKELNYSTQTVNFLFFGFIEHYKGLNVLAEAYAKLGEKYNNITLTIAGNGDFTSYKRKFADLKNFTLINRYIEDNEVGALFAGPNIVVVLPYINATQSGVIPIAYEYLTPIIASDTGGLKEQLDDGNIGLLFENGNTNELMERMEEFIKYPNKWVEQKELMKTFRETLDWDILAKRLLEIIRDYKKGETK